MKNVKISVGVEDKHVNGFRPYLDASFGHDAVLIRLSCGSEITIEEQVLREDPPYDMELCELAEKVKKRFPRQRVVVVEGGVLSQESLDEIRAWAANPTAGKVFVLDGDARIRVEYCDEE